MRSSTSNSDASRERLRRSWLLALGLAIVAVGAWEFVLRDAGFVRSRADAQRRIYRIESAPFQAFDEWLEPYRQLWTKHLDALERHLDEQEKTHD